VWRRDTASQIAGRVDSGAYATVSDRDPAPRELTLVGANRRPLWLSDPPTAASM
jgi:hypothetical protein